MKKIINYIKGLLKKYPEVLSVPVALLAWVLSVRFLRLIDQTTAVYDAGVFQVIIFAVFQLFVYVSVAWLTLGLVFGTFRRYLIENMKFEFQKLSPWQKIRLSYSVFFLLLFALVVLSLTL